MIFSRIAGIYLAISFGILIIVFLTINQYYVSTIKKQRVDYNQQLLSKVAYELNEFYVHSDYLLDRICCEEKYNIDELFLELDACTTFKKIKKELEFEQEIIDEVYTNGIAEYTKGVLVFDDTGRAVYTGRGVLEEQIPVNEMLDSKQDIYKEKLSLLQLPAGRDKIIGLLKTKDERKDDRFHQSVFLVIDSEKISNILKQTLLNNRSFFVSDSSGEWIYESGMEEFKDIEDIPIYYKEKFEKKYNVVLTSVSLELFSCHLYVVDKPQIIFEDINKLWKKVFIIIGIGAMMGTVLFLFISKKVLFPIDQIKSMIREVTLDNDTYLDDTSNDEFGEISKMINSMKTKIKDLSEEQMLLQVKTTEARLQVLQSQINPHFLYNTLYNIYCIAQIEEVHPITILAKNLSEMLRYSINTEQMFVTLDEEIKYVQAYLEIINVRYENSIELVIDIPEDLRKCIVFRLLLQPLVENACIHGILPSEMQRGNIYITAVRKEDDIFIKVVNSGNNLSDEEIEGLNSRIRLCSMKQKGTTNGNGTGIALCNVNERVRLFYGEKYGLEISRVNHFGTCVKIHQKYVEHKL